MIRHRNTFTPRELFSRMQGAWFEPRQGYMWQENTGVTPTTTGGQTIGKLVDLSADRVASQATAANRPNLQFNGNLPLIRHADSTDVLAAIMPAINVRRNLLTWSEDFSNAVWSKGNIALTKNSITNTGTISVYAYQTLLNINKSKCYAAIDAKYVSARYMQLTICSGLSTRYAALFDLISGNFVESASTSGSMSEVEWEITATSDGYYRIGIAGKTSDVHGILFFKLLIRTQLAEIMISI